MIPNQCKSNFHYLMKRIKNLEEYSEFPDKEKVLKTIELLYEEHLKLKKELSKIVDYHNYGIRYKTVEEDSSYDKIHTVYFLTEQERDSIFDDWSKELYWDDVFDRDLPYRTPQPNYHSAVKIFRSNSTIYVEESKI